MKAIVIDPGTEPVVKTVPETLQALGAMCGGALTLLRFPLDAAGLLYMEGAHSRGLEQNRQFRGQWYYGRLLIVGVAPYGVRFRSLTPEQIAMYTAKWREAVVPYEKVMWPGLHLICVYVAERCKRASMPTTRETATRQVVWDARI